MKKRNVILNMILALCLAMALLPAAALAAPAEQADLWTDYAAEAFAGGDGSAENPYEIATAEQLALLSKLTNDTTTAKMYLNKDYRLTGHIDLSGHYWVPIGFLSYDRDLKFSGRFDGDGYVISNMTIRSSVLEPIYSTDQCLGLFGVVLNGSTAETPQSWIRNVGLEEVDILCDSQEGTVHSAGGLVGLQDGSFETNNCWVTGSITNTGSIKAIGGLVGRQHCGDNCRNHIRNSYFSGTITGTGTENTDALVGGRSGGMYNYCVTENLYYNSTATAVTSEYGTGKTEAEMKTPEFAQLLGSVWQQNACKNKGLPYQKYDSPLWTGYAAASFDGGSGKMSDPYQIATAEQLAKLAWDVNYGGLQYLDQYFVLTADIDLAGHLWDPIGYTDQQSFAANFDGQSHVVKNMTVRSSAVDSANLGLFGEISAYGAGDLSNLGLSDTRIEIDQRKTYTKAGLLAGGYDTYSKRMDNCFARGEIIATAELTESDVLGGLIGYGSSIYMENCYFTGRISQPNDKAMLGGLVGKLYSIDDHPSEISNSYAAAQFFPRGAGLFWRNTGRYSGYCTLNNVYYDNSDSAHITTDSDSFSQEWHTSADGTGLSGAEMMTRHMAGVLNHRSGNTVWAQSPDLNGGCPVLNSFHPGLTDTVPGELILRKGGSEAEVTADTLLTATGIVEQKPYFVHVLDGDGRILPDAAVTWTVEGSDTVTVDGTGLVTVAADAPDQTCTVRVTSQADPNLTKSFPLTVQHTDTPLWTDNLEIAPDCTFSGGTGSEKAPYLIGSVRELAQLAANVNGGVTYGYNQNYFRLTQDLELDGKFWVPIGRTSRTLGGVFDGNGKVISGMKLRASLLPVKDNRQYLGFLGYSSIRIENLGMEGAELVLDQACDGYAGVLGGSLNSVYRCYVNDASITITEACRENPFQIGGLACDLNAYAESCWFRGTIDDQSGNPDTRIGVLAFVIRNGSAINSWSDAVIHTKSTDVRNRGSFCTVDGLPQGSYNPNYGGNRTREQLKSALAAMELNENRRDFHPWVWQETVNGGYPQLAVFCGELEEKTAANLWIRKGGYDVTEDSIVTRQSENALRKDLTAHVADRYGRPMSDQSVTWTVEPAGTGVTIDAAAGTVTVAPETAAGDYTITAVCGTGTNTVTLHVIRPDKGLWSDGLTANAAYPFSGGDGTEAAPYLISSETDLAQLAVNVNAGAFYDEKYFLLTRDLDLGGKYWVPIGSGFYQKGAYNKNHSFRGSFDGGFHTIDHMEILYDVLWDRLGEDYRQSYNYVGLFGSLYSNNGSIKNLALENASAAVYDWGRGFYAQGTKKDKEEETGVGLLLGLVHGGYNDRAYVDRCSAQGSITVGAYARGVGGLVGISEVGIIQNTFFKGSITQGVGYTAGGIAGAGGLNDEGSVNHSFSAADIHSRGTVYGVFCYARDACVYDSTLLPADRIRSTLFEYCHEQAMTTEQLKSYEGVAAIAKQGNMDSSPSKAWGWDGKENGGYPYLLGFETVKPVLWTDGVTADPDTAFAGGSGTVEDPYKIATAEQLALLAVNVNTGAVADGYYGVFFKLTADLDLGGKLWVPIGYGSHHFRGGFDGGLHTISNMTIRDLALPEHRHLGLFGFVWSGDDNTPSVEGAGIRNLLLTGVDIRVDLPGNNWVGSLVGSNCEPMERCGAEGTITAHFDVDDLGGLVGWCERDLSSCFFRGEISAKGGKWHGGLLGCQTLAYASRSYNCYVAADLKSSASHVYPMSEACDDSFYDQDLYTPQTGHSSSNAVGKTTEEMKTYAFAIALNGMEGNAWTSNGRDYPVLSGGQQAAAELPQGVTAMENTLLEEIPLPNPQGNTPGVWVWVEPKKSVGNEAGEKTFAAAFFPTDTDYAMVRADITVKVKKLPVLTIEDNAATPELELSIQNGEAGWAAAAAYAADGRLIACGMIEIEEGQTTASVSLGELPQEEPYSIKAFLTDRSFIPQTAAKSMP